MRAPTGIFLFCNFICSISAKTCVQTHPILAVRSTALDSRTDYNFRYSTNLSDISRSQYNQKFALASCTDCNHKLRTSSPDSKTLHPTYSAGARVILYEIFKRIRAKRNQINTLCPSIPCIWQACRSIRIYRKAALAQTECNVSQPPLTP